MLDFREATIYLFEKVKPKCRLDMRGGRTDERNSWCKFKETFIYLLSESSGK